MKTAEEFLIEKEYPLYNKSGGLGMYYVREAMIEFAKMHVQEALKQASEKADADFTYLGDDLKEIGAEYIEVYIIKDSILNAYSLENII